MFSGCSSLDSIDLTNFKTDEVININQMFRDCTNLISIDMTLLNLKNVDFVFGTFDGLPSHGSISLSENYIPKCIYDAVPENWTIIESVLT